jgi:hypothetical protein
VAGYAVALHGAVMGAIDLDLVLALDRDNYRAAEAAATECPCYRSASGLTRPLRGSTWAWSISVARALRSLAPENGGVP